MARTKVKRCDLCRRKADLIKACPNGCGFIASRCAQHHLAVISGHLKACNARQAAQAKPNGKNGKKNGRADWLVDTTQRIAKAVDEEVAARLADEKARLEKWAIDEADRLFRERVNRVLKDIKP